MHIVKLRIRDEHGLVPAGRYFEQLAKTLRTANAHAPPRVEREGDRQPISWRRGHPAGTHKGAAYL